MNISPRIAKALLHTEMLGASFRAPGKFIDDSLDAADPLAKGEKLQVDFWHSEKKEEVSSVADLEKVALTAYAELTGRAVSAELSLAPVAGLALLSDCNGKIDEIVFHAELGGATSGEQKAAWSKIKKNLSPDSSVRVATGNKVLAERLAQKPQHRGLDFFHVSDSEWPPPLSLWARDSMMAAQDQEGNPVMMIPERDYRPSAGDVLVPYALARSESDLSVSLTPSLNTRGGNLLSTSSTAFVGQGSVEATKALMQKWDPEITFFAVKEHFEAYFGKKVEILPQVEFDLDVFCHPLDDKTFAVADPKLARQALAVLSAEERAQVNATMSEKLGHSRSSDLLKEHLKHTPKTREFDKVATLLESKGYRVVRTPYLRGAANALPFLAYTNCLIENYKDDKGQQVKKIYLPEYGCKPLDDLAASIYREQGFETVGVELSKISRVMGQLRCMSQVVRRSQV